MPFKSLTHVPLNYTKILNLLGSLIQKYARSKFFLFNQNLTLDSSILRTLFDSSSFISLLQKSKSIKKNAHLLEDNFLIRSLLLTSHNNNYLGHCLDFIDSSSNIDCHDLTKGICNLQNRLLEQNEGKLDYPEKTSARKNP